NRDEALYFGTAHQQLHADPRSKRVTGNPAVLGVRVQGLHPVKRCCGVRQLTRSVIEFTLAAANRAEVEAKSCEPTLLEHVEQIVDDLVVHRSTKLWMRMQHNRDGRVLLLGRLVSSFKTACRTCENHFGHTDSTLRDTGMPIGICTGRAASRP